MMEALEESQPKIGWISPKEMRKDGTIYVVEMHTDPGRPTLVKWLNSSGGQWFYMSGMIAEKLINTAFRAFEVPK